MAILSALISLVLRNLSNLVRAVLGWSVTALFGRLSDTKQTALSGMLILSLFWPILVVGIFFPPVTAWAIAAAPVHKWLGDGVIRWITIALAVVVPPIVGIVSRWVAPPRKRSSFVKSAVGGYALVLGYAASCIVTAIVVPMVKLASAARRWSDEHVFVQPNEGAYERALADLVEACHAARISVRVYDVPRAMGISTRIVRFFARGALDAIVAPSPKMVKGNAVELYLYPADLLVRGEPSVTARVRARIAQSRLERDALLVAGAEAQRIQMEIQRAWRLGELDSAPALRKVLDDTNVPFDEWVILDRMLHRLEDAFTSSGNDRSHATDSPDSADDAVLRASRSRRPTHA